MFLFYEHISVPSWAKERATPCGSVQFSMLPNQIINSVGLSVVGSGQCSLGEVGGHSRQIRFKAVREKEAGGLLQLFFGQRIGCRKEFYGQPETAEKMLSVKFVPASYTPKGLFLQKNAVRIF